MVTCILAAAVFVCPSMSRTRDSEMNVTGQTKTLTPALRRVVNCAESRHRDLIIASNPDARRDAAVAEQNIHRLAVTVLVAGMGDDVEDVAGRADDDVLVTGG